MPNASNIPNLIKVQKRSYENFLQFNINKLRKNQGLENVFKSICNVNDPEGRAFLKYVSYKLCNPKYSPIECVQRGITYACSLKVTFRLLLWDEKSSNPKALKGIKEQEVIFGDVPLMTNKGIFVINGTKRVVVSQLHRSPGVFYNHSEEKNLNQIIHTRLKLYRTGDLG
jgi:DNA-directed RNA polymerase subunit beta